LSTRARDLPDDIDTEGTATRIREALVLRTASGDDTMMLAVALHTKLCNRTMTWWASYVADRAVGMVVATTATFIKNLDFNGWGERSSAVKLDELCCRSRVLENTNRQHVCRIIMRNTVQPPEVSQHARPRASPALWPRRSYEFVLLMQRVSVVGPCSGTLAAAARLSALHLE
jgi:hypothetical protein